jgi:hypothetical protein
MAKYIALRRLVEGGKVYEPGDEVKVKKERAEEIAKQTLGGRPILEIVETKKKGGVK